MSDYLSRIAARNLNIAEAVQPRLWSRFEPPSADGGQVFEERFGRGERDDVFVSDEAEAYPQTSMSPSSSLLADRSADSALAEEGRTKTAQLKPTDPQTPIQKKPQPDPGEAREGPTPEMTENIPVAISRPNREMAPAVQNLSNYSAAAVNAEPSRKVRRKAADVKPPTSEAILGLPLADSNKPEPIPATVSEKTRKIDTPSPSQKAPKKGQSDQLQTSTHAVTIKTETVGTVRPKAADSQPPSPETVVSSSRQDLIETKSRPYPNKMEAIPATANDETQRADSPSSIQRAPKQTPPDQRQTAPLAVTSKTQTVGTVRRKAVDNQPVVPGSVPNLPRRESVEAKKQPGPERTETTIVTAKSEIATPYLRQKGSPLAEVGFETARRVRQKVAYVQPRASDPIQSVTPSDLEITRRRPGPDNAPYLEVTTEGHPSSRRIQLPSGPERDRSPKVGIDGERRAVSGRFAAERELLLPPSSRAQSISPPEVTRFVAPTYSTKTQPKEANPTIQVKIGRVEVHALAPASPPSHSAPQPAPKLSLDEYLKQRDGDRL